MKGVKKEIVKLAATALMFASNLTAKANGDSYCPVRHRVRWSPYAGALISGDLEYNPHAFSHENPSGLVHSNVHYNPYAFSYKNPSGLVTDSYCYYSHTSIFPAKDDYFIIGHSEYYHIPNIFPPATPNQTNLSTPPTNFNEMQENYERNLAIKKARTEKAEDERKETRETIANDPARAIYDSLKKKGFKLENTLYINNRIISTNFILKDKALIIKYWNQKEICSLLKEGKYNKIYETYGNDWIKDYQEYLKKGWKIATVEITDKGIKHNLESLINSPK